MTNPQVSVVIPCYNGAAFLPETLKSALVQTHPPREIIVVDDGSTDESAEIAEKIGPPVRVIRQENQGESVARNVGASVAVGEYILFLDADDLLHARAIEKLLRAVGVRPGSVGQMGCARFTDDPLRPFECHRPKDSDFLPHILAGCPAPPHCWLFPNDVVKRVGGFDTSIQLCEDWDFLCKVALDGNSLVSIPWVGAYYRKHANSQTASTQELAKAHASGRIIQRYGRLILDDPGLRGKCGAKLFWMTVATIQRARRAGATWPDLREMGAWLEELAKNGPSAVRRTKLAIATRLFGHRAAVALWTRIATN